MATDMESKTIAFVDCCGYSAYTDEHGDAAGVEVYLGMRRAVERAAAGAGVVIVKWTGDGAMLAADNSTAALTCIYRAMLVMRESGPLALRAGVTVGPVTRVPYGELDYLGSAVNRAARLCADAAPWQVRVGRDADHTAMYFTLRPADVARATAAR
ncbi:MAG TPA: adenylate/guanylate cyclase domain-containing protein [Solirubrobacteraceae bacterium]